MQARSLVVLCCVCLSICLQAAEDSCYKAAFLLNAKPLVNVCEAVIICRSFALLQDAA